MRGIRANGSVGDHRQASRWFKAAVGGLLFTALSACNALIQPSPTPSPTTGASLLPPQPHVESQTVDQLYSTAGPFLHTSGDLEVIAFRCTIVEGTFCWFGEGPQDGPVPADLARRVVDQVGAKAIENTIRNEVLIECSRPTGRGLSLCEIDWGWGAGWEPLPLE